MLVLVNSCDEMLKSIFMHKAAAVSWVHGRFASYLYGEVWFYHVLFVLTYLAFILSSVVHSLCLLSTILWWINVFIDTDSVSYHSVLQSLSNTTMAPPWQFRLWWLLRQHKYTYLLSHLLYATCLKSIALTDSSGQQWRIVLVFCRSAEHRAWP